MKSILAPRRQASEESTLASPDLRKKYPDIARFRQGIDHETFFLA